MSGGWSLLASESLCDNPYLRVARETVATPTRPEGIEWIVAHRPEASVVAPRLADGRFVLIRQERVAVRRTVWELPAGQLDGRDPETTARHELDEEARLTCGRLISLGSFFTSVGFSTECCHLFLAEGCRPSESPGERDPGEAILEVGRFSVDELSAMIASGTICDANTLATFARLSVLGYLSP